MSKKHWVQSCSWTFLSLSEVVSLYSQFAGVTLSLKVIINVYCRRLKKMFSTQGEQITVIIYNINDI